MSRSDAGRLLANRLREQRLQRGLDQWEVAEALATLAREKCLGEIGLDAHAVSRHERGKHLPSRRYRRLYCLLYQTSEGELWPRHDPDGPDAEFVVSAQRAHPGTVDAAVSLTGSGDGPVERRTFLLSVTGAALTAPAHQWLVHEPGPLVSALNGDRVTTGLADRLPAMIAELRAMDDVQGGGLVLSLARRQFVWVTELLDNASYDEVTARKLHAALAELGQFAGWAAYDAGHDVLAQRYYVTALRAAHTADDRALGAHILASMAHQATRQDYPAEAVTLLETALVGTRGHASPSLLAEVYNRQAYAHAKLGNESACLKAIDNARAQVEQIGREDDPPWLYWVSRAVVTAGAGSSLLQLGWADQAIPLLDEGIGLFDDPFVRERQRYLTQLAEALACPGHQRDLDAAAQRGTAALELAEGLSSARSADRVRSLAQQLQPHENVPAVRDFLERARESRS